MLISTPLHCSTETYSHPSIASSACFRKLYDLIGDPIAFNNDTSATPCLALEWLDSTFADADVLLEFDRRIYILVIAIVETIMTSCISFGEVGLVNIGNSSTLNYWPVLTL